MREGISLSMRIWGFSDYCLISTAFSPSLSSDFPLISIVIFLSFFFLFYCFLRIYIHSIIFSRDISLQIIEPLFLLLYFFEVSFFFRYFFDIFSSFFSFHAIFFSALWYWCFHFSPVITFLSVSPLVSAEFQIFSCYCYFMIFRRFSDCFDFFSDLFWLVLFSSLHSHSLIIFHRFSDDFRYFMISMPISRLMPLFHYWFFLSSVFLLHAIFSELLHYLARWFSRLYSLIFPSLLLFISLLLAAIFYGYFLRFFLFLWWLFCSWCFFILSIISLISSSAVFSSAFLISFPLSDFLFFYLLRLFFLLFFRLFSLISLFAIFLLELSSSYFLSIFRGIIVSLLILLFILIFLSSSFDFCWYIASVTPSILLWFHRAIIFLFAHYFACIRLFTDTPLWDLLSLYVIIFL